MASPPTLPLRQQLAPHQLANLGVARLGGGKLLALVSLGRSAGRHLVKPVHDPLCRRCLQQPSPFPEGRGEDSGYKTLPQGTGVWDQGLPDLLVPLSEPRVGLPAENSPEGNTGCVDGLETGTVTVHQNPQESLLALTEGQQLGRLAYEAATGHGDYLSHGGALVKAGMGAGNLP